MGKKDEVKLNYYDWLVANDVMGWLKTLIDNAGWTVRDVDGKVEPQLKSNSIDGPWNYVRPDHRLNCGLWHQIMFDKVSMALPPGERFIPSKCQNCWKVVVRPKTIVQLFALKEIQEGMDCPCKCGIERRDSVHGLYGGYFYNTSIEEGIEKYHMIVDALKNDKYLNVLEPGKDIILKRACTEYEHACGDSDKWEITPEQLHIESLIERWVFTENIETKQSEKVKHHVEKKWIEWAYSHGDKTYEELTGGKPLYPKYKTYHHLEIDENGNIVDNTLEDNKTINTTE